MRIEFKYSLISDLVFHVLAHMQVNNASNLYSREYIESFPVSIESGLRDKVSRIENYYNANFARLCMINFLPIYCSDLESLRRLLLSYDRFSGEDVQSFIKPFVAILEDEFQNYKNFWESKIQQLPVDQGRCEKYFADRLNDCKEIFDYFGKDAEASFSLSLTRNGRGAFSADKFFGIVPYPSKEEELPDRFFQLFHEYTHQFTDKLLNTTIDMADGSHDISENLVILADYFIFQKISEETAAAYLRWIAKGSGKENDKMDEAEFINIFHVPAELIRLLDDEIAKIYAPNQNQFHKSSRP